MSQDNWGSSGNASWTIADLGSFYKLGNIVVCDNPELNGKYLVTSGASSSSPTSYKIVTMTDDGLLDKLFDDFMGVMIEPKCECGSDKVKSPIHSDWCPKYEEKKKEKK